MECAGWVGLEASAGNAEAWPSCRAMHANQGAAITYRARCHT